MKSVSILLLTTLLAALMAENASAAADAVIEEKAVPLEPLYPDSWYNGEGEEEDERDLRVDANLRAARVSETEGGLVPKTELRGTEDVDLRAARMELRAARMEPARRAELRLDGSDTASKNELGVPVP
jgi:hypothetical protein